MTALGRCDGLVVGLGIHRTEVHRNAAAVAGCGRSLRYAVVVEDTLRCRVNLAAEACREDDTQVNALVGEVVAPSEVALRCELADLLGLDFGHRELARRGVNQHVAVQVACNLVVDVDVGHRTALTQNDARSHVGLAQPVLANLQHVLLLAGERVDHTVSQLDNLVLVERVGEVGSPTEVTPLVVVADRELDTLVLDVTRLGGVVLVTGRRGQRHVNRLVVGVRTVVGDVEVELVDEACVHTDLPRLGHFRLQVRVRVGGRGAPAVRLLVVGVARVRQIAGEGRCHLRVGCAYLQEREPLRSVEHVRNDSRETYRRIEERRVGRVCQLRSPVVTSRDGQVEHRAPAHLDVGENRLRLVVPALLHNLVLVLGVEVELREEVGLLQVARVARTLVALVVNRGTDLGAERPVAPRLVDVGHHVAVEGAVELRLVRQTAVLAGEGLQRRSVVLRGDAVVRVVDAYAARYVEPVGDVPLERGVEHVAALGGLTHDAVLNPVGVLERVSALAVGPVLSHVAANGVPALVEADFVEVVAAREEVEGRQRVVVLTLRYLVLVVLDDEACTEVEGQLVLGELGGVAGREVVAVVLGLGDDVGGVGRRYRDVGLVLLRAGRERNRVDYVRSGVEEVLGIERAVDFVTPAEGRIAGAVAVLHLGHHVGLREHRGV